MQWGIDFLNSNEFFDKVLAVHGRTGCGKSHLVDRLLLDVENKKLPYIIIRVNANNKGKPRKVLQEIFKLLYKECKPVIGDEDRKSLDILLMLADDQLKECHLSAIESKGVDIKLDKLLLMLSLGIVDNTSHQTKDIIGPPTDSILIEWIQYLAAILFKKKEKRSLIFVDDLDLLDLYGLEGQDTSYQVMTLLKALAESKETVIIVTMRPPYFRGREKDCTDFINVKLLDPDIIKKIYKLRIDFFHEGKEIFTDQALDWIERGSFGRIGNFLRRCGEIYQYFYSKKKIIGISELRLFIRQDIIEKRADETTKDIMAEIEQTIKQGQVEMQITQNLDKSNFLYNVLSPISGRISQYSINPLYVDVIREIQQN